MVSQFFLLFVVHMMERKIEWEDGGKRYQRMRRDFFFLVKFLVRNRKVEGMKICSIRNNRDEFIDHPVK